MEIISKWSVQRSAVRSIAWLDVGSPSVDQTANNKTADAAKDTSTGDQGENPGMQATPNPQADTTENQASEGAEPRDSNE